MYIYVYMSIYIIYIWTLLQAVLWDRKFDTLTQSSILIILLNSPSKFTNSFLCSVKARVLWLVSSYHVSESFILVQLSVVSTH